MSLKAKIEAVVYAAEEPVTLAQLATLFSEEALEWKREHQAPMELSPGPPNPAAERVPLPSSLDLTADSAPAEAAAEPVVLDTPNRPPTLSPVEAGEPVASPDAAEAEARRFARQRDREARDTLRQLLDELIEECAGRDRGIEIREIAGGYRIGTKPEYHDSVRTFVKSLKPPMKLSLQALETLAVIAYKQPVTAPEVSEIRGVDTSGVLGGLISRKLITTAGRKQVIGRPILYKTTKEFLLRFGLKDVNELPSIEEFEKFASELIDSDVVEEADSHAGSAEDLPFSPTSATETELEEAPAETDQPSEARPSGDPISTPPSAPEDAGQDSRLGGEQAIPEQDTETAHRVTVPAKEED